MLFSVLSEQVLAYCIFAIGLRLPFDCPVHHVLTPHVAGDLLLGFGSRLDFGVEESLLGTVVVELLELVDVVIDLVHCNEALVVLVNHTEH
mgnify:CR=1 FL=1